MTTLKGKVVELVREVANPLSVECIPAGLKGRVDWDEGGDEVVVEFVRAVPDGGFKLSNERQAWISRTFLHVVE